MRIKKVEIDEVSKIKEPIMDYAKNGDKLYISAKGKNYSIDYTLENEEKAFKLLKDSIELFTREKDSIIKEIKAFNKLLVVTVLYALLFIVLSVFLTSFLPLIFTVPSIIFGIRSINSLKDLNEENDKITYDLYIQNLNLESREIDLKTNRSIEAQKQRREQEIQNIEAQIEELNEKFGNERHKPKQKVLSLK